MKEAAYYTQLESSLVCKLCPHQCQLQPGKSGRCRVRRNMGGKLIAENYNKVSSLHLDPIEKKPLYHYYPGSSILSAGSVGCNLQCKFCQNSQISQCGVQDLPLVSDMTPDKLVEKAMSIPGNIGLAFTYNEPIIWYEYVLEAAQGNKRNGKKNIMVSNGYIEEKPLQNLTTCVDAFNIDLKAFTEDFYRTFTFSSLQPVLNSLKLIKDAGKHLEITFLVIPDLNDSLEDFDRMVNWISENLGKTIPLHLSRYFPMYRLNKPPTPISNLTTLFDRAKHFLDFVYLGNVSYQEKGRDTYCPSCRKLVVSRENYLISRDGLDDKGNCMHCHQTIAVV